MPTKRHPRRGSMQFWPRKRSARTKARIRTWAKTIEAKPLGFTGYKVGMTHALVTDNNPHSHTKKMDIVFPLTVVECPPMKVAGINVYGTGYQSTPIIDTLLAQNLDKNVRRIIPIPKKTKRSADSIKLEGAVDIRLLAVTQPHIIGFKKTPEIIELGIGGASVEDKIKYAKEILGKEISVSDVFAEGNQIDVHAITKGKGTQGPVKRFGVDIRSHKSEKTKRGPGNVGPWNGNNFWTIPKAGQMGYHQRTELNKWLLKIGTRPEEIAVKGGFKRYGIVKNNYILLKGSVAGPAKRAVTLTHASRPNKSVQKSAPAMTYLSLESKQ